MRAVTQTHVNKLLERTIAIATQEASRGGMKPYPFDQQFDRTLLEWTSKNFAWLLTGEGEKPLRPNHVPNTWLSAMQIAQNEYLAGNGNRFSAATLERFAQGVQ